MTRSVRFDGAVLAGGGSTRMGRDKALIEVGGRTMAARVVDALEAAGAGEVLLVGGDHRSAANARHVPDRFPGEGPLGGILTALGAARAEWVAVCACDLPWLDTATVERLGSVVGTMDAEVYMARTDRREPLCAFWHRETTAPLLQAAFDAGERAIHVAVHALRVVEVGVAARPLTNVNTPEDLRLVSEGTAPRNQ